jgi:cytochrome b pre-mRNA-processing protein 3
MFNWLAGRLAGRTGDKTVKRSAERLYAAIVAQARHPYFYRELSVADTIPGRFEMIALHMFLVLSGLRDKGQEAELLAQELVDVMFQDMDDVAREIGVGDMGVAPRIKKLARSFRSRLEYYQKAIESDDGEALPSAILEIYFENDSAYTRQSADLADYMNREQRGLTERSVKDILTSIALFGEPTAVTQEDHQS